MITALAFFGALADNGLWHRDIGVAELLAYVSGRTGRVLAVEDGLAETRLFVFARPEDAARLQPALAILLDARWERRGGVMTLAPKPDSRFDIVKAHEAHRQTVRSWLEWQRTPGATLSDADDDLRAAAEHGQLNLDRDSPAAELVRHASAVQVNWLAQGGALVGSTEPGKADVTLPAKLIARQYDAPPGKHLYVWMCLDDRYILNAAQCWEGMTGSGSNSGSSVIRSPFDDEDFAAKRRQRVDPTEWDLLEPPPPAELGEALPTMTTAAFWAERAASSGGLPVLGIASPLQVHRDSSLGDSKLLDGCLLVRPPRYLLAGEMRRSATLALQFLLQPSGNDDVSRLDRIASSPELIEGLFETSPQGRFVFASGPTGIPSLWLALGKSERQSLLGDGLDLRRTRPDVWLAVRRCLALSSIDLSAFEAAEAIRLLESGTPLRLARPRSNLLSARTGTVWKYVALPLKEPLPPDVEEISLTSMWYYELECGPFRGKTRLARRFHTEQVYRGPLAGAPDLANLGVGKAR